MRQVVHCNGCNSQIPTPDSIEGKLSPQFLKCEKCGNEVFWNCGLTDNSEPLILFSIEDSGESLDTTEVAEIDSNLRSTDSRSAESGSDNTNLIVDLEIQELDIEPPQTESPEISALEISALETAALETAALETAAPESAAPESAAPESAAPESAAPESAAPESAVPESAVPESAVPETAAPEITAPEIAQETQIEPASQPQSLVHSESVKDSTETTTSETQSHESKQLPSGPLEPLEHVPQANDPQANDIEQQLDLDPPNQSEHEPIVNDTVPAEPFALELEIESEQDAHFLEPETHQSPTAENAAEEVVADNEEEAFTLGGPHLETEPIAETLAIENAPIAEQAVAVDSSPAVDWSVLGPTVPRRRPKEASAIRKILPPVLGGLAAFPIATLILWYGFGKDIGTTGPTVAKYVPWIVPEKFRSMPFESSPSNFASGRNQRSAPSNRNTLPTLNREETTVPPNDDHDASGQTIASEKPKVEPEQPSPPSEPKAEPIRETAVAKIPETLEALKSLQKEMENATDNKAKMKVLVAIDAKLKELSKQSSELTGPSARTWNKQLEAISRKILADSVIPGAIKKIANRERAEIPASKSGDFVATVIAVSDANVPSHDDNWLLHEKWESDEAAIPIEILPGAWRPGSSALPSTCLVLGRLLPMKDKVADATNETTGAGLVLKVHLLVPK
jgi:chemotaxis protein histidine kinase CheA